MMKIWLVAAIVGSVLSGPGFALADAQATAPGGATLAVVEERRFPAPEARQGVVADKDFIYAINNHTIGKYRRDTGERVAIWDGDPARFKHVNSCIVHGAELMCAASNYPETPMLSTIEWFDRAKMQHVRTKELGHVHGSLTWIDWHDGSWWACFANYDSKGGEPGRDHRATVLVRYDEAFRELGSWTFPDAMLARMAPKSSSGGIWGPGDLLYVTGHDAPELYVLRVPAKGKVLELVAIATTPTGGQAIGRDMRDPAVIWSISREGLEVVASRLPKIDKAANP